MLISEEVNYLLSSGCRRRYSADGWFNSGIAAHYISTFNHLTPNGHYMGRTALLTSRCCILYIYSANIRTEYFKHAA